MTESPEEKEALEKLDAAARDVAWQEEQKEADRELNTGWSGLGVGRRRPLAWFGRPRRFRRVKGDPVLEPMDDPDPAGPGGLRDALRDDDKKS